MAFPNRELSQFGSFLLIDDNGNTIGIATNATPTIGIGTTSSDVKLTVIGDTNISGIVRASQYFKGNDELIDVTVDRWSSEDNINIYRLDGNVGIGNSLPIEKLDVNGNIQAGRFISTVSSGTAPFVINSDTVVPLLNASFLGGKTNPSGAIVGDNDTQTLTNKTIQNSQIIATGTGITFNGSTSSSTNLRASAIAGLNTLSLPTTNGTLVSTGDTGSVTSNMILDGTIVNADISAGAAITYTKLALSGSIVNSDIATGTIQNAKLANSTISGVGLGSTLANLTAGSFIIYNSGSTYNGSVPITISANASSLVSGGNNLVARDVSGDFAARNVTLSNLTGSQQIQAADFNSTNTIKVNSNALVDANRNINAGVVTATNFNYTSSIRINGTVLIDSNKHIVNAGVITATKFVGDGSGLTALPVLSQWVTTAAGINTLSNVGIGTTHPTTNLEVRGEILATRFRGVGNNNFFGQSAGLANTTGSFNNFFGCNAGCSNTTGSYNSFFGHIAGKSNIVGSNSFFGFAAGFYNTTGNSNSFFGRDAGYKNTTGGSNAFFGGAAGYNNTTGSRNVFFGGDAGCMNTAGSLNTFVGGYSGQSNTTGSYNSFFGGCSGRSNTTGRYNSFFGRNSGQSNTTGECNVFIGNNAGSLNNIGLRNNFIGSSAGNSNTTGCYNNFFGTLAGFSNSTGCYNLFIGDNVGLNNSTGSCNIFFGRNAGFSNNTGSGNVVIGHSRLDTPIRNGSNQLVIGSGSNDWIYGNSSYNVGIGTTNPTSKLHVVGNVQVSGTISASRFTPGGVNIFFGSGAGGSSNTGSYNNFFGYNAGRSNTSGYCNNFLGYAAGFSNSTGVFNNFFGNNAGCSNNSGCDNSFFGHSAGSSNTNGSNNTFFGSNAGRSNQTGSNNVVIGHNRQNTPILNGSNQLVIGSDANDWIYGNSSYNVGIGTTNPTSKLTVGGDMLISGISTVGLGATSTPPNNSQLSFELISNTQLRFKVRGTDGVLRSSTITLA